MAILSVDSSDLHYEVQGSGPTVVLTSGGMSPGGAMQPLAKELARSYQVITWDRPNQGASQVCFDDDSELDLSARRLRALLDHLQAPTAHLVGASEGTRVNTRFALRYPDVTRGLFMWQISAGQTGATFLRESYYEQYARLAEADGMAAVARTPWWSERIKFNLSNRERLLTVDPELFAARMNSWASEVRGEDAIYGARDEELAAITCPAWIVAGVDPMHPRENSERVARLLGDARLLEAPYGSAEFDEVKEVHDPQSLMYVRYADLPGILPLLEEFLSSRAGDSRDGQGAGPRHRRGFQFSCQNNGR